MIYLDSLIPAFTLFLLNFTCITANPLVGEGNQHHGRRLLATTTEDTPAPASSTSDAKTIWEKIEEFYSDKNNFAMYLVLPAIVLVYGGCAMIYCIAKCRQYFKRKKDKKDKRRLQDDVDDAESDDEILRNNNNERKMSSDRHLNVAKTAAVAGAVNERPYSKASVSDVRVEQRETPLPWVIPEDSDPNPIKKHPPPARPPPPRTQQPHEMVMSDYPGGKHPSGNENYNSDYPEKTQDRNKDNFNRPDSRGRGYHQTSSLSDTPRKGSPRPQPVPLHENPKRHGNRHADQGMMSPPPPYESHQHHAMGASVFTVDYSRRDDIPRKVPARPMYNPNPKVKVLSQTRGGGPVSDLEAQAMARHAAQLLRLEDKPGPGMPGYKKPKRLVFVAE